MRYTLPLFALVITTTSSAQFTVTRLDKTLLPKSVLLKGKVEEAVRWTDKNGDNIAVLTRTDGVRSTSTDVEGGSDRSLYAYRFVMRGDSAVLAWKVQDHVTACDVDMFLNFVKKTFTITDLNKDGKAEVWIMYKISCQGDVSPVSMKIIMYEDNKKFAVRGDTRVDTGGKHFMGGEYSFDEAFKNGPAEFRTFAEKLWKAHKTETWNNND